MKRMKTCLIYIALVIAVILATDLISNLILQSNYKQISKYEISTSSPEILITEAKTTNANGLIKGTVTNKTEEFMQNMFLKVELLSNANSVLGEEYIKLRKFSARTK